MDYVQKQRQLIKEIEENSVQQQASLVEIEDDYLQDKRICLTIVAFPSPEIISLIEKRIVSPLKEIEPGYFYYPAESMHLTIKNVRTINNPPLFTQEDVEKVDKWLKEISPKLKSFSYILEGLAVFPRGIPLIGYSGEELKDLVQTLDQGLKDIGVPDNKKYYSSEVFFGNITLCRCSSRFSKKFLEEVKKLKNIFIGEMPVKEISLIICNGVCSPLNRKVIGTYKLK